jgi:hypothetical protein
MSLLKIAQSTTSWRVCKPVWGCLTPVSWLLTLAGRDGIRRSISLPANPQATGSQLPAATRSRVLSLYRALLRAGSRMPTAARRAFVYKAVRTGFRGDQEEQPLATVTDARKPRKAAVSVDTPVSIAEGSSQQEGEQDIEFKLTLAETALDNVRAMASHLDVVFNDPKYWKGQRGPEPGYLK